MFYNECESNCGRVAQLGEHLLCKQGVAGSIPATSTIFFSDCIALTRFIYSPRVLLCTNCARIKRFQYIRVRFERRADSPNG